jgi:acid stress chaperone HdeB
LRYKTTIGGLFCWEKKLLIIASASEARKSLSCKRPRLLVWPLPFFFVSLTAHAQAQVTVDVSKITCNQFVEYKIADPKQIATWINGYYHGAQGSSILDAQAMLEITNTVEEHCFKHPGDLVMKSVEGAMGSR